MSLCGGPIDRSSILANKGRDYRKNARMGEEVQYEAERRLVGQELHRHD